MSEDHCVRIISNSFPYLGVHQIMGKSFSGTEQKTLDEGDGKSNSGPVGFKTEAYVISEPSLLPKAQSTLLTLLPNLISPYTIADMVLSTKIFSLSFSNVTLLQGSDNPGGDHTSQSHFHSLLAFRGDHVIFFFPQTTSRSDDNLIQERIFKKQVYLLYTPLFPFICWMQTMLMKPQKIREPGDVKIMASKTPSGEKIPASQEHLPWTVIRERNKLLYLRHYIRGSVCYSSWCYPNTLTLLQDTKCKILKVR